MANPVVDRFKVWAFPGVISVLAAIIWQDVKEIKADVKELIAQSAIDKTRIDNLERELYGKKSTTAASYPGKDSSDKTYLKVFALVAIRPEKEEYTLKKLKNVPNTQL